MQGTTCQLKERGMMQEPGSFNTHVFMGSSFIGHVSCSLFFSNAIADGSDSVGV